MTDDRLIAPHLTAALIAQALLRRVRFAKLQAADRDAARPQRAEGSRTCAAAFWIAVPLSCTE
jgi:hypothetical protein